MPLWPKLATALLYFAAGAATLALAHRAVRRTSAAAAAVLLLLPLTFTGRALLTGRSYAPFDLAYHAAPLAAAAEEYGIRGGRGIFLDVHCAIMPWRKAVAWAFAHGEWPLWNPFMLCGDPLAGSAQPAPYYPVNLLALLLPLPLGFTFSASFQLLLAALAAFLWCRELGCREQAALVGAAGWTLSSFVGFWLEWPLGATLSLAPLVLLAVRRLVTAPGWRAAGLLAATLLLACLAGHPESLVHLVALGTVAGLLELAARRVRPAVLAAVAGWALLAGAVALGLAAVFLLPVLEVLAQTIEWQVRMAHRAQMNAPHALADALRHLGRSLIPPQDASPGEFFLPPLASAYAGTVLLAPALYGLARGRSLARWALAALGLFGVAAAARLPGLREVLTHVPLMGMAINDRLVFFTPLALAGLAALGVEAWLARREPLAPAAEGLPARPGRGRGLGVLALALAAAAAAGYWLLRPAAVAAGVDPGDLAAIALWAVVPLAAAGAALAAGLPPRWGAALLLAALLVQRAGEMGSFYPALPPEAFYPRVPPLDTLPPGEAEPYRVVGHQYAMVPNDATMWEIEDPRGYQAIHHLRFAELVPLWSVKMPVWYNRVQDLTAPLISMLNVRYALTGRRYRPEGWNLLRRTAGSWLWENPRVLGRAFVPRRVRLGVGHGERLREMAAEKDFYRRAWIEPPGGGPARVEERQNARGWAVAARRGSGYRLTARLRQPGWVVITATAWNGWRAVQGGRELPLGIANHAFLALELPAGLHEVDLFYRPRAFDIGLAVSGATAGLLAVAAVVGWARGRRRRRGDMAEMEPAGRADSGLREVASAVAAAESGLPPEAGSRREGSR